MTLQEFLATARQLEQGAVASIAGAASADELAAARNAWLGRKSGRLTELMKALPMLPAADRRDAGAEMNRVKTIAEAALATRESALAPPAVAPSIDATMPARRQWRGAKHPVTLVIDEIVEIFRELGFTIALGPEGGMESAERDAVIGAAFLPVKLGESTLRFETAGVAAVAIAAASLALTRQSHG